MKHRLLIIPFLTGIVVALVVTVLSPGLSDARPRSRALVNQAVAVDTNTGHRSNRVAWMLRTTNGGVLPSNYAKAQTWCNDCRTNAIALQIVLMSRVNGPTASWNHAVAANSKCARCTTAAAAFQFAVISNSNVWLTESGMAQLSGLRRELEQVAASDGGPADVNAAATAVAGRVLGVLRSELRSDGSGSSAQGFFAMRASQPFEVRFQHEANVATG